jgi:UDP-N-acetylmuramoyl-tripeptide--D-alanyl-D-alanine ligase
MRLTLAGIAETLGLDARAVPGLAAGAARATPTGASTDNRQVRPGHLFFCLPGERADGHDFAPAAVEAGACAVIGVRDPFVGQAPVPLFLVSDAARALGDVARAHRDTMEGQVVGVTGSAGKTSVKEALAQVLARAGETARNPLNRNNRIGLPLSMLNASEKAAYWVMEAGISKPRDMDELGAILHPDLALVLNVGPAHTEFLGDRGVPHYKAKLFDYLTPGGVAVAGADYPELLHEARSRDVRLVTFSGRPGGAPFSAGPLAMRADGSCGDDIGRDDAGREGRGRFRVAFPGGRFDVTAPFQGAIGAENTAAVAAAAFSLGLDAARIAEGLRNAEPPAQRARVEACGAYLLVDDSYNANPLSMARMLDNAAALAGSRSLPLVLVLGEMGELGGEADMRHERLGAHAASLSPAVVFWRGGCFDALRRGLSRAGYGGALVRVAEADDFLAAFRRSGPPTGLILCKGSRARRMDNLADALRAAFGAGPPRGTQEGAHAL